MSSCSILATKSFEFRRRLFQLFDQQVDVLRVGILVMKLPLTGTSRPPRYGAAVIDNTLAMFAALATGGVVGDQFRVLISKDLAGPLGLTLLPFVFLSYFFLFEWLFNATPGKMFVGLTVRQLEIGRASCRERV